MTIRLRLALIFTVAVLVLLAGGGYLFVSRLETGLENSLTTTLDTRADAVIAQLGSRPAQVTDNPAARRGLFGSGGGTVDQLLTGQGEILTSTRSVAHTPLLTASQARAALTRTVVFDNDVVTETPDDTGAEPMRILAKRVGGTHEVLAVAVSRDVVDKAVTRSRQQLVALSLAVLLLAGLGSWLLTRAALRPVERMRREASELNARNAGAGVQVPDTHDEIARLGHTFNGLLGRLHDALSREQALVADAGHELRTPLTVLKGELELARRPGRSRAELAGTVEVAAEETDRLVHLTEDLLFLSADEGAPELPGGRFDLTAVIASAVRSVSVLDAARATEIIVICPEQVSATGNPDWIRQAVQNLLVNALRYAPPGTAIRVTVTQDAASTRVSVADDGPGFPPQFIPFAFNRFTRADGARARSSEQANGLGGNGLGLAIVRSVLARHGGTAVASNRPDGGAVVVLTWPHRGALAVSPRQ